MAITNYTQYCSAAQELSGVCENSAGVFLGLNTFFNAIIENGWYIVVGLSLVFAVVAFIAFLQKQRM